MTKPIRYKTAEEVINEKRAADAEELRQLRNLKRNLESEIVFEITSEIRDVLENNSGMKLKREIIKVKNIPPELMYILLNYETKDL